MTQRTVPVPPDFRLLSSPSGAIGANVPVTATTSADILANQHRLGTAKLVAIYCPIHALFTCATVPASMNIRAGLVSNGILVWQDQALGLTASLTSAATTYESSWGFGGNFSQPLDIDMTSPLNLLIRASVNVASSQSQIYVCLDPSQSTVRPSADPGFITIDY